MGYQACCALSIDGEQFRGTAHLETSDVTFRGETRLAIPFARITTVFADAGRLVIVFDGREARFEIGAEAAKWANRIANPPSRADKLGIKAGMSVALIDLEDDGFAQELAARGATVATATRSRPVEAIFVGVRTARDLTRLASLAERIVPAGAIWVVRQKGKTASVTEAESMAAARGAGLVDVKVVSFSSTHSAEKYVIPVAARARAASAAPSTRPVARAPRTSRSARSRGRR